MHEVETNMVKKDKSLFKMPPEWIYTEPIDLEHKQYVLLDFLKYCDRKIDKFEVYPAYTELSIHLANLQSISSEFKTLYFEKKLFNVDDEIFISDLKFKSVPIVNENDYDEFTEIVKFSGQKVLDYFNIMKAVWNIVYDSISLKIIKNEKNIYEMTGYFYCDFEKEKKVWKYQIEKKEKLTIDSKMNVIVIKSTEENFVFDFDIDKKLPIFELKAAYDFPLEPSLLPAFKRKILNYIIQKNTIKNLKQSGV